MADRYPEFRLRLPNRGPTAYGRQTDELGTNGSRKFVVAAGQPVRPDIVPSFSRRVASAYRLREQLIDTGRIRPSQTWPRLAGDDGRDHFQLSLRGGFGPDRPGG
ncbi:hypothetical protein ACSNOK_10350 [Streptomyces sp. URMC 126]|uniref:hypothetical protein n=1 Tax=Streptomyces sp. URMC 126 TaxID=3423401 RepID=UPI003F193635